jgi:hypothetical protein
MVADSLNPVGVRLSTLEVVLPRFLLAEANTHRMLSRNAESGRAKSIQRVLAEPVFTPIFTSENRTMKAGDPLEAPGELERFWATVAEFGNEWAKRLALANVHHSITNRLLEPFRTVKWLVSFTESANFLALRFSPEAEPHFQAIAALIILALREHTPVQANEGDWHIPYLRESELSQSLDKVLIPVSVARCARVSYGADLTKGTVDKDLELYDRLLANRHMSPFEHVAQATSDDLLVLADGNFRGWSQYRKAIDGENKAGAFDTASVSEQVLEAVIPGWRIDHADHSADNQQA